ncbi:formylglycine-generating enzyme family protein [Streptomyces sp. NBC_00286]|nr:formylglycine-generating enzyme family protein [Streptomyces sp. NBC_00286]
MALPGGTFRMGGEDADANPGDGEGPIREVTVGPFEIDTRCVTNERFAAFVDATGYRTDAERFGWSYVFARFLPGELRKVSPRPEGTPWWCGVQGAYWAAPEGPGSELDGRWDHPVVHVSWGDALAFCRWEGSRLPTEAEWEYAARGGLDQKRFPWGDELTPGGEHRCNIWQGRFPFRNTAEDGYKGTAPVDAFPPNGFGLFNTSGNVWEWCADWWGTDHGTGPHTDPTGPEQGTARVMRGGSYLCHDSYCNRYRVAARTSNTPDSSVGNLGFRCVRDPAKS